MTEKKYVPSVAYLGPEASFTHIAASDLFGMEGLTPRPTIPDCIEAVTQGHVAYAVVPLENALEGSVPLTIDYLFNSEELFITAEISTPIEQHMLVNKTQIDHLDELDSIQSHPHALAQCHKFLQYRYRGIPLIQTTSTAAAAKMISEQPELRVAAIGNRLAAETYGLHIAEENIHDFHFNHTRFVVLSLRKEKLEHSRHASSMKTTLMVKLPEDDRPGMLHQILSVFSWRRLNLSKIESRPLKTGLGHYFFIIDINESEEHPMMKGAMEELDALGCTARSFGTYYVYESGEFVS
ncbi:prephenate dehydratase [Sporosarcina sp. P21c]|uniref:prephenate dehydratase n=1 Tax=Sporosarcina TaxID=1569 RepID=UPI000A15DB6E|nr:MULTISPECIES: prephenate dehydratase [Sporosarcina]ARJ37803.1 prephenate dehydratase [Sporosarcina ureae]PIC67893.1 prephenate dehydratase [Sporosarcina sp. P16a]PIC90752.1 prephenate dehydratase [Sporosarcina sp. P21c]PIC93517.1 prephenate dehydratase [Sporosarcina sp. P25]